MKQGLLGNTIRQARLDCKMTQEELAEAVQITPTHMKYIESEHRKPSVEVLFALVSVLHISLDALLIPESAQSQTRKIHQINSMLPDCTDDELDVLLAALHELERQKRIKE